MSKILELREKCIERLPPHVAKNYRETERNTDFLVLALCGEVGELANLQKKLWRGDSVKINDIHDEIADVRVYLELIADNYDIAGDVLDKVVADKLEKIVKRYSNA